MEDLPMKIYFYAWLVMAIRMKAMFLARKESLHLVRLLFHGLNLVDGNQRNVIAWANGPSTTLAICLYHQGYQEAFERSSFTFYHISRDLNEE